MIKRVLFLTVVMLVTLCCSGQSISPLTADYSGVKAKGQFTVINTFGAPLSVAIDPVQLAGSNGTVRRLSIDTSNVHLKMDSFLTKIGARQQHTFFYELTCTVEPCVVSLFAAMTLPHHAGLNVGVRLPHTIYLCSKEKQCRQHVRHDVWGVK